MLVCPGTDQTAIVLQGCYNISLCYRFKPMCHSPKYSIENPLAMVLGEELKRCFIDAMQFQQASKPESDKSGTAIMSAHVTPHHDLCVIALVDLAQQV